MGVITGAKDKIRKVSSAKKLRLPFAIPRPAVYVALRMNSFGVTGITHYSNTLIDAIKQLCR